MNLGIPRLCYVCERRHLAYFTTQSLDTQWGDDWDDPLDNSGSPYEDWNNKQGPAWKVFYMVYDSYYLKSPDEDGYASRMGISVQDINKNKRMPWLSTTTDYSGNPTNPNPLSLFAGNTIYEVMNELAKRGIAHGISNEFKEYLNTPSVPSLGHPLCPSCKAPLSYVQPKEIYFDKTKPLSKDKIKVYVCPTCNTVIPGELYANG